MKISRFFSLNTCVYVCKCMWCRYAVDWPACGHIKSVCTAVATEHTMHACMSFFVSHFLLWLRYLRSNFVFFQQNWQGRCRRLVIRYSMLVVSTSKYACDVMTGRCRCESHLVLDEQTLILLTLRCCNDSMSICRFNCVILVYRSMRSKLLILCVIKIIVITIVICYAYR